MDDNAVPGRPTSGRVESLNALTLATRRMNESVEFYESLGLEIVFGGRDTPFTTFRVGDGFLNIQLDPEFVGVGHVWGRAIFWVDDVDAMYDRIVAAGFAPGAAPSDAPWGERYFPIRDPEGHDLSFARRIPGSHHA